MSMVDVERAEGDSGGKERGERRRGGELTRWEDEDRW
jgi:hypothetical protein